MKTINAKAPAAVASSYATDGKCHNAQIGTYGHECGKPATWLGTTASGFTCGFCDNCKTHGHDARTVTTWSAIAPTPPTPSRADTALTQTLKSALALIDVRVLDHVIVSGGQSLSMAERGLV